MSKQYISLISVKVKTPIGYKPRSMTFKFGYVSDTNTSDFRKKTMGEYEELVKKQLEEQNPGVSISVTSSMESTPVTSINGYFKNKK